MGTKPFLFAREFADLESDFCIGFALKARNVTLPRRHTVVTRVTFQTGLRPDTENNRVVNNRLLFAMPPNDELQQPVGQRCGLHTTKSHHAGPVCCNGSFGVLTSASAAVAPYPLPHS